MSISSPAPLVDDVPQKVLGTVPQWLETLAVFDLETTGIDVMTSRVVTANIAVIDGNGSVTQTTSWLADPGVEIPEQASAVHGISTEHAREHGRPVGEVVAEISATLRSLFSAGIPLVVYNAPYDLTLLAFESARHGVPVLIDPYPVIDPLVIDKAVDRFRKGKRTLTVAAAHYGVDLTDAHDAGADALAAGRVAQAIGRTFESDLGGSADALHRRQIEWARTQAESFQEYMRRTKDPGFTATGEWPLR